jgi:vacuolar-type H+-ATPase subunit E/Vma4
MNNRPQAATENLNELIDGIVEDASREAEKVLAEAEKGAASRREAATGQAAAILKEGEELARRQAAAVIDSRERTVAVELRRSRLRIREEMIARTIQGVRSRLAVMIGEPEYSQILVDWITEAAIGLNAPRGTVNASEAERKLIDAGLLSRAEQQVRAESGLEVSLAPADGSPLQLQGVTLTAEDGRTAFNNQVETRLLRYQSEIRKIIHDRLFT